MLGKSSCHQGILQPLNTKDCLKNFLAGAPWCCRPCSETQAVKRNQAVTWCQAVSQPPPAHAMSLLAGQTDSPSDTGGHLTLIYTHLPFAPNTLPCFQKTGAERVNLSSAKSSQWSSLAALSHCNCQCLLTCKTRVDRLYLGPSICYISSEQDSSSSTSQTRQQNIWIAGTLTQQIFKKHYFTFSLEGTLRVERQCASDLAIIRCSHVYPILLREA